jgi:tRNA modification GTPase
MPLPTDDTIAAIATAAGRGGIGMVRLSGGQAWPIARAVLLAANGVNSGESLAFEPWRAVLAKVAGEDGSTVDEAIVTPFSKPHSYTAEDMVEITCHGSPVVLRHLLERCTSAGARLAEPGEFTMRAFLNGRIDLAQAEAVRDLIEARTLFQAKLAAQQVEGSVARWLAPIKSSLTDLIAMLEAGIDFAEDDVSVMTSTEICAWLEQVISPLEKSKARFTAARMAHDGLTLALVGRPNVGKSSLFNRLVEQDRAIVTAAPGTTRDLVAETVEIEGIPLRFVDTAGIREAFDEAESIGIQKSQEAAADADLAIVVIDASREMLQEDRDLLARLAPSGKVLVAANKVDLPSAVSRHALQSELDNFVPRDRVLFVSAQSGEAVAELRQRIVLAAAPALGGSHESALLTNLRQQLAVESATASLHSARRAAECNTPHEMLLLDLYASLQSLDELTGATTNDDILGRIFSTFCVGK